MSVRPRRGFCALLCGAVVFGIVPSAGAAPAWLAPAPLSAAGQDAVDPGVAFDPQGNAVAVWARSDGTNTIVQTAVRPAAGTWQAPVDLSAPGQDASDARVAIDAHGNALAVWARSDGANTIVQAAVRPVGGAWQAPVDLSAPGQDAYRPQVAFDPQGGALVIWLRSDGADLIVQAAGRSVGGAWEAPTDLSAAGESSYSPHVAFDAHGDAIAGWNRASGTDYVVQAAERPAGSGWQAPVDVSDGNSPETEPTVAIDAQGTAVAVWRHYDGTDNLIAAAVRPAGGVWQAPVELSAPGQSAYEPQVAFDAQGNAAAVWFRHDGATFIVQAAVRPAGGAWQAPVDLSAAGETARRPQVAFDPEGNALAVWAREDGPDDDTVQAAARPADGAWQAPVDLGLATQLPFGTGPQLAVDAEGNALASWFRADGANTIVQGAGYDATAPLLRQLSVPASGTAGQSLSFSVAPVDAWSPLGATTWTFGDGRTAVGTTVTHTYAAAGSHPVTVTSADAVGNAAATSRTITIAPAPAPVAPAPVTLGPAPKATAPPARCTSRRSMTITLFVARGTKLRRTVLRLDGKRVKTLGRGTTKATVSLVGRPAGRVRLTVDATSTRGRRLRGRRTYNLCHPGRLPGTRVRPLREIATAR